MNIERLVARIRQEEGLGLIEVMISAAVLLLVATTVLTSLDQASKMSGMSRAKGVAANLALQDQERIRSLKPTTLANYYEVKNVRSNGNDFVVTSTGTFVSEATRTPGCTSTARADFVKITSQVKSKSLGGAKPVYLESLVNPAVGSFGGALGSMVVKITNATGGPVAGVPVAIAGPGSYTQPTSAEGCAFFAYVPIGSYAYSYSVAGWVDQGGNTDVSGAATVQADRTSSYETTYDQAGAVRATFETRVDGAYHNAQSESITLVHPNVPGDGSRVFPATEPPDDEVRAGSLFPFSSPYSVYTGSCASNALPDALFTSLPAERYQRQIHQLKLFEPAIDLVVTESGTPVKDARVFATASDPGCASTVRGTTKSDGKLEDPGFPFGTWTVCADVMQANGVRSRATVANVVNDKIDGVDVAMDIPPSTTDLRCAP
jgi:Tfp pilus assembly protein PilV